MTDKKCTIECNFDDCPGNGYINLAPAELKLSENLMGANCSQVLARHYIGEYIKIPTCLKKPLVFGDSEQVKELNKIQKNIEVIIDSIEENECNPRLIEDDLDFYSFK